MIISKSIHAGIYLALLKYDDMKYQPLIDLTLIPNELLPEKILLPKSIPFIIYEIRPFAELLSNMISYMIEYEKMRSISKKTLMNVKNEPDNNSPLRSISQLSTTKRTHRAKSTIDQTSSSIISPDFMHTPLSILSTIPNHDVDIRKYAVTDPQRINLTSIGDHPLPFTFRKLNQKEQQASDGIITLSKLKTTPSTPENTAYKFNENELVLFKQRLTSVNLDPSFALELKNCIHQLAIDKKLGKSDVRDILIRLDHKIIRNQLHNKDIANIIRDLQEAAESHKRDTSLSNLMKTLLRIDHLGKFNQLDNQKVKIFNERMNHLARMGILNQQSNMFKKLFQLALFESEPNQQAFSSFVDDDLQRIISKQIPLNMLGIKEILHQLQLNIDRLGPVITLILIDNIQRLVHSGLLLTLNKTPQLKQYLIQFMEHIQSTRFNGVYLQRLIEQMNSDVQMNTIKKVLLINQLNSLLQKNKNKKTGSKQSYDKLISILMNLAYKGQLNTYFNDIIAEQSQSHKKTLMNIFEQTEIDSNNLQSLLVFLHEQSTGTSGHLPHQHVRDFIQYLRHFARLGILYQSQILYVLTDLHKAKDQNNITSEVFQIALTQFKSINYIHVHDHLNLIEFEKFLNDMISDGNLTRGQTWYILNRLIDLCRTESVTNYDIKILLANIQLEHNRQELIYPKLNDFLQSLSESYSNSLTELHDLERDLQRILSSNNNHLKRIPDEIRRCLNDMINLCKKFSNNRIFLEQLFGQTMNYKIYNKMKEILKTKNFLSRKQSFTAIIQMHKHFLQTSRLNSNQFLYDHQLDLILQIIQDKCSKHQEYIQEALKHMVQLGYLQDKSFVDYLTEHILSNELWNNEKCIEIRNKLQTWPFTLDLNHPDIRQVVEHLKRLEIHDQIDTGTYIEIQNRLNQLARYGKCLFPRIKFIINELLQSQGKTHLSDEDGFRLIQSYRLMLNDITHAIQFELYVQQLTSDHQISDDLNYRFRHFLYQILQNELSIDELIRYHLQLEQFYHVNQMDIDQVKRFIELLPKNVNDSLPLTLTDKLLERLKWDGKILEKSIRDKLLKFERSGVLSQDTFEEFYNNLYRTLDIFHLSLVHDDKNQILLDLFNKLNDLQNDDLIDLHQSIEIKDQLYLLEDMSNSIDLSHLITIQSRLLNSSDQTEFNKITEELRIYVNQEQFRLSKAQDLILKWQLSEEKGNSNEKHIIKLLHELANINRLYNSSNTQLLNRFIQIKPVNQTVYRHLIKDLQRLKDHALIDRQAIECIRSIEGRIYKFDQCRQFNESLIKTLENRLKQIFTILPRSLDQHLRIDICKKLNQLIEVYIKSKPTGNQISKSLSNELLDTFDSYIIQIKQGQLRPSTTRHHYVSSDAIVPKLSPSLQSLKNIY